MYYDEDIALFEGGDGGSVLQEIELSLGQSVFALSVDDGIETISMGFVSGYRSASASSTAFVQTSIVGSSGAPVVTFDGVVVGLLRSDGRVISGDTIKILLEEAIDRE